MLTLYIGHIAGPPREKNRQIARIVVEATIQLVQTRRSTTWKRVLRHLAVPKAPGMLPRQRKRELLWDEISKIARTRYLRRLWQKTKVYSKYGKQLYVAAKNGAADPDANPALRSLIEKAKRDQVPAHVIDKAIQKARGVGGEDFSSARYEGFGPGGSLVIVDCLTDNNQRTISEVRSCFTKTGSKLAATGSVALSFDRLAILSFKGDNE